jgi:hypothetical protein
MASSVIGLVTIGVLASAAVIAGLSWLDARSSRRGQLERRQQALLDVYAEREIARERLQKSARKMQKSSPHGTILQLQ